MYKKKSVEKIKHKVLIATTLYMSNSVVYANQQQCVNLFKLNSGFNYSRAINLGAGQITSVVLPRVTYDNQAKKVEASAVTQELSVKSVAKPVQAAKVELTQEQLKVAWNVTVDGVKKIKRRSFELDTLIYYTLTALAAKEHIMVDGPGGGAKTFQIKAIMEAQLRSVNGLRGKEREKAQGEVKLFVDTFFDFANEVKQDSQNYPSEYKIWIQQMFQTMSESKILGSPNPFRVVGEGSYELDFSNAAIDKKFVYYIVDELEKASPQVQMTFLSILNERQSLIGDRIIQTSLETAAATTNANLADFIAQSPAHEVGGRRALVDRFVVKVHITNITADSYEGYLMAQVVDKASEGRSEIIMIDLRRLSSLLSKVEIPKEVLSAMTDISINMDTFYTKKVNTSMKEAEESNTAPDYYSPWSGSIRSQVKAPQLWKAAFLARQIMNGGSFETLRLKMQPHDLIDLAPALLHGGPDFFVPDYNGYGYRVSFFQNSGSEYAPMFTPSNLAFSSQKKSYSVVNKNDLSLGHYDPITKIFQYSSTRLRGKVIQIKFDPISKKLVTDDQDILNELMLNDDSHDRSSIFSTYDLMKIDISQERKVKMSQYYDLNRTLAILDQRYESKSDGEKAKLQVAASQNTEKSKDRYFEYTGHGLLNRLLTSRNSKQLRAGSRRQLQIIQEADRQFLNLVNSAITALNEHLQGRSFVSLEKHQNRYKSIEKMFVDSANKVKELLARAKKAIENKADLYFASAMSIKTFYREVSFKILESESTVKGLLHTLINHKNAMLFGPPGAAKTMISRILVEDLVESMTDDEIFRLLCEPMSEALAKNIPGFRQKTLFIKQFHPMSTEGEIVGRIDMKDMRDSPGTGIKYKREGTMSAKGVLFALLDEFEKAPPGVMTSLLSILNERKIMDGHEEVVSSILAVIISTNSTPSEFMRALGAMSTAFPIYDRIHAKIYTINKLSHSSTRELHRRVYSKFNMAVESPLVIEPLRKLSANLSDNLKNNRFGERELLITIFDEFKNRAVPRSETEIAASADDSKKLFYMQNSGESNRTALSKLREEFSGAVVVNRILNAKTEDQLKSAVEIMANPQKFVFEPVDLIAWVEILSTYNGFFVYKYKYNESGMIEFYYEKTNLSEVKSRLDSREEKMLEDLEFEAQTFVEVLNVEFQKYIQSKRDLIEKDKTLFPTLFSSQDYRDKWLKQ